MDGTRDREPSEPVSKPERPVFLTGRGCESPAAAPCVFRSGHLMASVSSKSEKRFLVNFQTKNAMMPMTATPPATAKPTMEPVPKPLDELSAPLVGAAEVLLLEEDAVVDDEPGTVMTTPLAVTTRGGCVDGGGVGELWEGVVEDDEEVVEELDVVDEELEVVEDEEVDEEEDEESVLEVAGGDEEESGVGEEGGATKGVVSRG